MKKPKEFSCLSGSLRKSRWILDESIFFCVHREFIRISRETRDGHHKFMVAVRSSRLPISFGDYRPPLSIGNFRQPLSVGNSQRIPDEFFRQTIPSVVLPESVDNPSGRTVVFLTIFSQCSLPTDYR